MPLGHCDDVKREAVRLYLEGTNFRRVGRVLGVNHQSVMNWVNAYHASPPPTRRLSRDAGDGRAVRLRRVKKAPAYVVTLAARATRCLVAWAVRLNRTPGLMQSVVSVVDAAPPARSYYSDAFSTYREFSWWGAHTSMYDKSEAYPVEGTNADLRHLQAFRHSQRHGFP